MRSLVVVALLLGGCAVGDVTPLAGQEEAIAIVWHQTYGETRDAPPIYWRRDRCNEPNGMYPPVPTCSFDDLKGDSVSGLERDTPWHVEIGAPWGAGKISDTALAHELLHASIGDSGHSDGTKWNGCPGSIGPQTKSLLCQAREALIAAGL
jgi:hypothetical protein